MFVPSHQSERRARQLPGDRQVADFIDDEQRRMREGLDRWGEPPSRLGFFKRRDQVGERAVLKFGARSVV